MRILIADDHALLRDGLRQNLAEEFPQAELYEAGSTQETLKVLSEHAFDVVILDIFMPGRSGLEILDEIRHHYSSTRVIVLTSAPEEQLGLRVLKGGASGYLNKQTAPENLVSAVKKVMNGARYIGPALAEKLAKEASRLSQSPHERLSDREFQVMRLLLSGKSLKEIAVELSLSSKTISTFHIRIWEKLNVKNDIELVRYALAHGLVESGPLPLNLPSDSSSDGV